MINTRLFAFAALALSLAACTNDNEMTDNGPVAAQFTAAIGDNVTATTRVSGTEGTTWNKDDCIGITGGNYSNVPYVTEGNGYFGPASDDIIYSSGAKGSTYSPEVSFTDENAFSHCMSRITLNFKEGSGVTIPTDGPTSYTLKDLLLQGTFDPTTGQTATTANSAADVTLSGNLTSSIFFPQTVSEIEMKIVLNENTYNATLPVDEGKLQSGKEYHYEITISHKDVMVNASIKAWDKVDKDVNVNL